MEEKLRRQEGEISICEDSNSIWGYTINRVLSESQGEVNDYRFRSIFLKNNEGNKKVAQGIWNKEEAIEIQSRFIKNKPDPKDYYEKEKWINFSCNKKVFEYLVEKNVFQVSTYNPIKYGLNYPRMFGEKENAIEINAFVSRVPFQKNIVKMWMHISTNK